MKRIPVDECPAGRELDAAAAKARYSEIKLVIDFEHGLIATSQGELSEALANGWIGWSYVSEGPVRFCIELSKYSTGIAAAWELVEDAKKNCWADFIDDLEWKADSSSTFDVLRFVTPLTITRAYLKAKWIEFVEVPEELCAV